MKGQKLKRVLILILFQLTPLGEAYLANSEVTNPGERMIPTVTGLDFDKVELFVAVPSEFTDRLYGRAVKKLSEAGLYKASNGKANAEKIATLRLELDTIPLDEKCRGKVMYVKKLELWEKVFPERNPGISASAVTWSYAAPIPVIVDRVSVEQLEADLDKYIFEFITAYKMGNPPKK